MPYGQDEAIGGYGNDPEATYEEQVRATAQGVAAGLAPAQRDVLRRSLTSHDALAQGAQGAFSAKVQDALDTDQEAKYLEYAAASANVPAPVLAKARQLWIVKPQYDLDYIVKNLASIEKEVQAEKIPMDLVAVQHPVLAKYLKDPATVSQALQDSATLTGIQNVFGGTEVVLKPDGTVDEKYRPAPWMRAVYDSVANNTRAMIARFGYSLLNADEKLTDTLRSAGVPELLLGGAEHDQALKEGKQRWLTMSERYDAASTHAKDYRGFFDRDAATFPQKLGRLTGWAVESVAKNADLLAGMAMGGRLLGPKTAEGLTGAALGVAERVAYTKGVFAFNTAYTALDLFPRASEEADSPWKAALVTAAAAPVVGKLMQWSPAGTAVGARADSIIRDGVARAASDAMASRGWPSLARALVLKGGWDAATGQVAMGLQAAAAAEAESLALSWGGKPAPSHGAARAFWEGVTNLDGLPLSVFGTAHLLVADVGRMHRARQMADSMERLRDHLLGSKTALEDPALHEQQVKEIAQGAGVDPFFQLPINSFNDTLSKKGLKPREVAAEIYGDGGAAYDKAVAEGREHLSIPIEKMRAVFESKHLGDLAMNEGTLDIDVLARAFAAKATEEFQTALDTAMKADPEKLPPEEKSIYDAALAFAGSDAGVAQEMYAKVKALQARHPELQLQQIWDATWGPGGLWGPSLDAANEAEQGAHRKIVDAYHGTPFSAFREFDNTAAKIKLDTGWLGQAEAYFTSDRDTASYYAMRYGTGGDFAPGVFPVKINTTRFFEWGPKGKGIMGLLNGEELPHGLTDAVLKRAHLTREELKNAGDSFLASDLSRALSDELKARGYSGVVAEVNGKKEYAVFERAAVNFLDHEAVPEIVQMVERESGLYNSKEWMKGLKDEQAKLDLVQKEKDAQTAARVRLETALKAGVRKQIAYERSELETLAHEEIKKDPGQRLRHFFHEGELWGSDKNDPRLQMLTNPETGKPWKLLASEVAALGFKPEDLGNRVVTEDPTKAIDIDAAANALGFPGTGYTGAPARKMLVALRDALPEAEFRKQWADAKLKRAHGNDLLENPKELLARVLDAVHNEKVVPALLSRLRALQEQLDPIRKARSTMTGEMYESFARKIIEQKALRDVKPEVFARAAKAASERALEALNKGAPGRAFDATEAALLNHYLYRLARETEGSIGAMYSKLNERATSDSWRTTLGKADPAYRRLNDVLLGALGMHETGTWEQGRNFVGEFLDAANANGQAHALAADVEGGWSTDTVKVLLGGTRSWKDLTLGEAKEVFKAITNIHHIAKEQHAALSALQIKDRQGVITRMAEHLGKVKGIGAPPGEEGLLRRALSPITDTFGLDEANLTATRLVLKYLGPEVHQRVWDHFVETRVRAHDLFVDVASKWKETQKIYEKMPNADKPIVEFEGRMPKGEEFTKLHLIQAAKWFGSETGRRKLLKAFDLPANVFLDAFAKHLSPEIMQAIQAEHAFFDAHLRPLKAEAWERRTGLPWEPVKAMEYTVPFMEGDVKVEGGYYPIHWDRRDGVSKTYEALNLDEPSGMDRNPKIFNASNLARTGYVGFPNLAWNDIPSHIKKDVHDLAFGDFLMDTGRLLLDPAALRAIRENLGQSFADWPRAWLERVKLDGTGPVAPNMAKIVSAQLKARRGFVTSVLGVNPALAAGDLVHPFTVAAARDGYAMAITYAMPSMARVSQSLAAQLATGVNPLREEIHAKSDVVRMRADTVKESLTEWYVGTFVRGDTAPDKLSGWRRAVERGSFWHLHQSDMLTTEMIWDAKYRRELDAHGDEMKARKAADEQVLASMPDYDPKSVPAIMAKQHDSIASAVLVFFSYRAKLDEMRRESKYDNLIDPNRDMGKIEGYARYAGTLSALVTFGIVAGDFVQGRGKQDNEDGWTYASRKFAVAPAKLMPYLGEMLDPMVEAGIKDRRPSGQVFSNPYFAPSERIIRSLSTALLTKTTSEDAFFNGLEAALMLGRLPANWPLRPVRYGYEVAAGNEQPRGPFDVAAGGFYGRKYGRSAPYNESNPFTLMQDSLEASK